MPPAELLTVKLREAGLSKNSGIFNASTKGGLGVQWKRPSPLFLLIYRVFSRGSLYAWREISACRKEGGSAFERGSGR